MRAVLILCLLVLTACGRPLSAPEVDLASRLFGDGLDVTRVRMVENGAIGVIRREIPVRPRVTCRERIAPPPAGPTIRTRVAGMVLFNHVQVRPDLFLRDYAEGRDGQMNLAAAMYLAHELTHVWQWQNREMTGYSPLRVSAEHVRRQDPYLFDEASGADFLEYGYEQQASLVEEYVCCAALDPGGARTGRLRALLAQVMEPGALPDRPVRLPWAGAETRGICS